MVVAVREYVFVIVASVLISLVVLAAVWPWTRQRRRLITIALAMTVGILIWNTLLNVTNAQSLNVDSPVLGLSVQDVGSGVAAFLITLLVLRFVTDKTEPVGRVTAVSAIVGVITIVVDLFG